MEYRERRERLLALKNIIKTYFTQSNWLELEVLVDEHRVISRHSRLLRSLDFGDPDYEGCILDVLCKLTDENTKILSEIEHYVEERFEDPAVLISAPKAKGRRLTFTPLVFKVPEATINTKLLSVMMPFSPSMGQVYASIKEAANKADFECQRADDLWINSNIIDDIFSLIFTSKIVVCDFTGKNPNIFYEAGIAHTLGKDVIPIAQHESDLPFDLRHHRCLFYYNNTEGLGRLQQDIYKSIVSISAI